MSRFDTIAESIGIEIGEDAAPKERMTKQEEALVGLLSKVLSMPCQKRFYHHTAKTTCMEDIETDKKIKNLEQYFVGDKKPCAVCTLKLEIETITGSK